MLRFHPPRFDGPGLDIRLLATSWKLGERAFIGLFGDFECRLVVVSMLGLRRITVAVFAAAATIAPSAAASAAATPAFAFGFTAFTSFALSVASRFGISFGIA